MTVLTGSVVVTGSVITLAILLAFAAESKGADDQTDNDSPALPESLKPLEPLFGGVWVAEGKNDEGQPFTLRVPVRPILKNQFVFIGLAVIVDGKIIQRRAMVVAPDAQGKKLKRRSFYSDGHTSESTITPTEAGNQYDTLHSTGVKSTAVHSSKLIDQDTWELTFTKRTQDGEALPDQKYLFKRQEKVDELPTEFAEGSSAGDHLKPWQPLLGGNWKSVNSNLTTPDGKTIHGTVTFWSALNDNFVSYYLRLHAEDQDLQEMVGTIGWDASAKKLRRWEFSSDGTVAQGTITPQEGGAQNGVSTDSKGTKRSSTVRNTFPNKDTWIYAVTNAMENGEERPDIKVTLKREKEE